MNLIKNKRADKILSIYWFAVLILVAGGVFGMVYVYYGTPYDVRGIEANILIDRIADCISYAGRINANFISNSQGVKKTGTEFLKECHLNFKSNEWDDEQYYTEVSIYKLEDMGAPVLNINAGDNKWLSSCELQQDNEKERLAQCVKKDFYSLDDANNQYIIKILAVARKTEKNVKI